MRWLAGTAVLAGVLVFAVSQAKDSGQLRKRRQMISGLGLVCKLYASDHGGAMPPDLRAVFPAYVDHPRYLAYATNEVEYFPGATDQSNPATLLMREKRPDGKGRRWVCHTDCAVEMIDARRASSPFP